MQQVGIEGCGGASGGVNALLCAEAKQKLNIMSILADAGVMYVMDTGEALISAAGKGHEVTVQFLLRQQERRGRDRGAAYVNTPNELGQPPLFCAIGRG